MAFANHAPREIDPIVAASIASFGFVYIHPFMDGNGRLSRFLFHKALCTSGQLEKGALLPVSVAMKRNERQYLETLQAFSIPARERVQVTSADVELRQETQYLAHFDAIRRAIDERHDVRGSLLGRIRKTRPSNPHLADRATRPAAAGPAGRRRAVQPAA